MKIIKIGGSVITKKSGYQEIDDKKMANVAGILARAWKMGQRNLVVVHGAGSFGHAQVIKHQLLGKIESEDQKLGFADTHQSCCELNNRFVSALIACGIPAVGLPPAAVIKQTNKRIKKIERIVLHYVNAGFLPVLFGDIVPDTELGGSVCSGDQIVAKLAKTSVTQMIALGTNVDGVLDKNGKLIETITKSTFREVSKHLKTVENDVTGGMSGKIKELLALSKTTYIFNAADHPERLLDLLAGKKTICTQIEGDG